MPLITRNVNEMFYEKLTAIFCVVCFLVSRTTAETEYCKLIFFTNVDFQTTFSHIIINLLQQGFCEFSAKLRVFSLSFQFHAEEVHLGSVYTHFPTSLMFSVASPTSFDTDGRCLDTVSDGR